MIRARTLAGILAAALAFSSVSAAFAQSQTPSQTPRKHRAAGRTVSELLARGNIPQPDADAGQPFGYENSYATNSALTPTAAVSTPFMADRFYSLPKSY